MGGRIWAARNSLSGRIAEVRSFAVARATRQRPNSGEAENSLTAAQLRELDRRVRDLDDPRRYIIKSVLLQRARRPWELYYDVSDDMWAMDITGATLFKRKKTAVAVAALFERGDRVQIEEVLVRGKQILRRKVQRASQAAKSEKATRRGRSSRNVQTSKGRR